MSNSAIISARRIDADRHRIDRMASHSLGKTGVLAYRHAAAAIRLGHDPVQASRDVLLGNDRIGQPGLTPALKATMTLAHLRGMRRSQINAGYRKSIALSAAESPVAQRSRREREMLAGLLLLDDDAIAAIDREYETIADRIARQMVRPLLLRLGLDADRMIRESTRDAIREVAQEFDARGMVPRNPYAIEAVTQTATVHAYERGRFDGFKRPEIKEALWGFQYVAILDDRTTELCWTLNGTMLPIDDPFWLEFIPPNHWRCRSCIIEHRNEVKPIRPSLEMPELRILRSQFRPF